ncbi:radical SAM protein, partial [bacterium]|nr:radical SAM protein [bacterium]
GCFGACSFCSITAHQGADIVSRSEGSIIREITEIAKRPGFNGVINDLGGPTANMYGMDFVKGENGHCALKECLFPKVCDKLPVDHSRQIALLKSVRKIKNIKHIFISSGIRYDLILADKIHGEEYLREILTHHISGQMKIAPEHTIKSVTDLMNKPDGKNLKEFKDLFDRTVKKLKSPLFLTYYFIAAFPGCTERDQTEAKKFISAGLKTNPKQVQIFTPTPSTEATALYWTEKSFDGRKIFVEKNFSKRKRQKEIITERKKL